MKFFMPNGKEISAEEFVEKYSDDYYLKENGKQFLVPGIGRNSKFVEKNINDILRNGIQNEQDVARIIAWKVIKIKHRESEDNQKFIYASDWANAEQLRVTRYSKPFPLDVIAHDLTSNIKRLENLATEDPQKLLNEINKIEYKGMGSVYLVTLLYFLSKGKYPIYDQFAMNALSAIKRNIIPKSGEKVNVDVEFTDLPVKESKGFKCVMENEMAIYIGMLNETFGDKWKTDRRYDQALWVYGHLFTGNKKHTC